MVAVHLLLRRHHCLILIPLAIQLSSTPTPTHAFLPVVIQPTPHKSRTTSYAKRSNNPSNKNKDDDEEVASSPFFFASVDDNDANSTNPAAGAIGTAAAVGGAVVLSEGAAGGGGVAATTIASTSAATTTVTTTTVATTASTTTTTTAALSGGRVAATTGGSIVAGERMREREFMCDRFRLPCTTNSFSHPIYFTFCNICVFTPSKNGSGWRSGNFHNCSIVRCCWRWKLDHSRHHGRSHVC